MHYTAPVKDDRRIGTGRQGDRKNAVVVDGKGKRLIIKEIRGRLFKERNLNSFLSFWGSAMERKRKRKEEFVPVREPRQAKKGVVSLNGKTSRRSGGWMQRPCIG
jgi:hypothetical protein